MAYDAGFQGDPLVTAVAVGLAESECRPLAMGTNGPTAGCPSGSSDRGLWQINSCYSPTVLDGCAYDAACNARAAYSLSAGGTEWNPWAAYKYGGFRSRLGEAVAAVDRLGVSGPGVTSRLSNRLNAFKRGADNALWHRSWNGSWSSWESLGGVLTSEPAAVSWGFNRIDVFVRGPGNALWHRWWGGSWSAWVSLGGKLTSAPTAASWGPGRIDVFVRGPDRAMWQRSWSGAWSSWTNLGGVLTSAPAAVSRAYNRIDVLARGTDHGMWHKRWDGTWRPWAGVGGTV